MAQSTKFIYIIP